MSSDVTLSDEVSDPDGQRPTSAANSNRAIHSFQRDAGEAGKLLAAVRRRRIPREAFDLARLIEHKLSHEIDGVDEEAQHQLDRWVSFVRHRFTGRLVSYEKADHRYGLFDTTLNVLSIFAGAASAIFAATHANKWIIILLGSFVAILQSISQWIKPSQRASRRSHAAARLRDEGWDFVLAQDRYKQGDITHGWQIFYAQVNRIAQQEEAAEEQEASKAVGPPGNVG
jgi:hypothetical protein